MECLLPLENLELNFQIELDDKYTSIKLPLLFSYINKMKNKKV
jgi:hypothetical protein